MTLAHHPRTWDQERALEIIRELQDLPGALLPILHALHGEFGYVSSDVYTELAEALNLSRAEVVGVVSFYHDFRDSPPGRHKLQICRAEACQSMGCNALIDHITGQLGVELGETTADHAITVEAVYCLGNCSLSPAVMLDGRLYGQVSKSRADSIIKGAREQA